MTLKLIGAIDRLHADDADWVSQALARLSQAAGD
jgi:hypothetical protein